MGQVPHAGGTGSWAIPCLEIYNRHLIFSMKSMCWINRVPVEIHRSPIEHVQNGPKISKYLARLLLYLRAPSFDFDESFFLNESLSHPLFANMCDCGANPKQ